MKQSLEQESASSIDDSQVESAAHSSSPASPVHLESSSSGELSSMPSHKALSANSMDELQHEVTHVADANVVKVEKAIKQFDSHQLSKAADAIARQREVLRQLLQESKDANGREKVKQRLHGHLRKAVTGDSDRRVCYTLPHVHTIDSLWHLLL
jgi:hypothetical protein